MVRREEMKITCLIQGEEMVNKHTNNDVFLVPLVHGGYAVGHIIKVTKHVLNSVFCAFYSTKINSINDFDIRQISIKKLISIQFTTPDMIKKKKWPIVYRDFLCDYTDYISEVIEKVDRNDLIGIAIEGSGIIREFLSAYHGQIPWDEYLDPAYFDNLLLPDLSRPQNLLFKRN